MSSRSEATSPCCRGTESRLSALSPTLSNTWRMRGSAREPSPVRAPRTLLIAASPWDDRAWSELGVLPVAAAGLVDGVALGVQRELVGEGSGQVDVVASRWTATRALSPTHVQKPTLIAYSQPRRWSRRRRNSACLPGRGQDQTARLLGEAPRAPATCVVASLTAGAGANRERVRRLQPCTSWTPRFRFSSVPVHGAHARGAS